jgi:predicted amidophosphoribosyltransferase
MNKFIDMVLSRLFPSRSTAVDFSAIASEELLRTSPRAASLTTGRFPARCNSILSYKYPRTRTLVWQIKYKRDPHALRHGGFILYETLAEQYRYQNKTEKIILVPIPVSPARRRERGYNQCELLAKVVCNFQKENVGPIFDIRTDILFRSAHNARQTLKNRSERLEGAHGIFAVHKKYASTKPSRILENELLKSRPVIILDDVLTTGSTIREAMLTLEKSGFKNVSGLTLAH